MRRMAVWAGAAAVWWLGYSAFNAAQYHQMLATSPTPVTWRHALTTELASGLLWIPLTVMALWLAERFPLGRPTPSAVLAHLAGFAVTVLGRAGAVVLLNGWVHWYEELPPASELLMTSLGNNLLPHVFITGAAHAVHYARAYRVREAQLALAQLDALRAQVRPHFLFNALNTIVAFVRPQPEEAERMIMQLSVLLRRSLDTENTQEVPLGKEIDVVRAYLDIEQARFGDRLMVSWDLREETMTALVPPLLLQPLVENAVRHGLWPRPIPGTLRVSARRDGAWLRLRVEDDGLGIPPDAPGTGSTGIGLANVESRLRQLYDGRHAFTIAPRAGGGTVVSIGLPYRERVS